jgi:hypothetical protein
MEIKYLYDSHCISKRHYDDITDYNCGDYIVDGGETCKYLWDIADHAIPKLSQKQISEITDKMEFDIKDKRFNSIVAANVCNHCKDGVHYHANLRPNKNYNSRRELKTLNILYPYGGKQDRAHTMLDLASYVYHLIHTNKSLPTSQRDNRLKDKINNVLHLFPVGTTNSMVTSYMVASFGGEDVNKYMTPYLRAAKSCHLPSVQMGKYIKNISVAVRRSAMWHDGTKLSAASVSKLAYMELFVGREMYKSDWKQEMINRCFNFDSPSILHGSVDISKPEGLQQHKEFIRRLKPHLENIFHILLAGTGKTLSWEEFVKTRQEWMASGSNGGYKPDLPSELKGRRLGKRATFETIPEEQIMGWIDGHPRITAVAADKYEAGKPRAIYGVDVINYFIQTYVLQPLERRFHYVPGFELGLKDSKEIAATLKKANLSDTDSEMTMLDYADFNIHHSLLAQKEIFLTIVELATQKDKPADYIKAAQWTADAYDDSTTRFPGEVDYRKIVRGMFSGSRATNFINTIMNLAYFQLAQEITNELYPEIQPDSLYNVHHGDDVWLSNKNRIWAAKLFDTMKRMGFVMQTSKQMFGRRRGEFLRVLYNDGVAQGYLNRAIIALVLKPLQAAEKVDPLARCSGLSSQVYTLVRRGYDISQAKTLWLALIPYWNTIRLKGDAHTVNLPLQYLMAPISQGGAELVPPGCIPVSCGRTLNPAPKVVPYSKAMNKYLPHKMVDSWIDQLPDHALVSSENKGRLASALHSCNVADSLDNDELWSAYRVLQRKWMHYRKHNEYLWKESQSYLSKVLSTFSRDHTILDLVPAQPEFDGLTGSECTLAKISDEIANVDDVKPELAGPRYILSQCAQALASTPFKDLSNARLWYDLPLYELISAIAASTRNADAFQSVRVLAASMQQKLSNSLLNELLSGLTGSGVSLQQKLHPLVISTLNKSVGHIILRMISYSNVELTSMFSIMGYLNNTIHTLVRYSSYMHKLVSVSRY